MSLLTVCAFVCVTVSLLTVITVYIRRWRFQIYCISEWPTFGVGWPREGTSHLPIILQVKTVIFRDKPDGHPDQVPYILAWQDMTENPPPRLKPFLSPKAGPTEILALRKAKKETDSTPQAPLYPVLQDSSPEDLILPLPYLMPPHPSAPPLEAPGAAEGAPPLPDEGVPVRRPAIGTRGRTHWAAPPPNVGPANSTALPLCAMGPPNETGEQPMLYCPFSTRDL